MLCQPDKSTHLSRIIDADTQVREWPFLERMQPVLEWPVLASISGPSCSPSPRGAAAASASRPSGSSPQGALKDNATLCSLTGLEN